MFVGNVLFVLNVHELRSSSDIIIDFEQKFVTTGNLWPLKITYFWEVTKYMYFLNWLFRVPRKRTLLEFWEIPKKFWIMIIVIQVSRQLFFSLHVQIRCTFWLLLLLIKMLFSKVRNDFTTIIWNFNTFSCNLWF